MTNNNSKSKTIPYEDGKEAVMVRVDKTVKEMIKEKPSSRWDAGYWHPKYEELKCEMSTKFKVRNLDDYMLPGIEGITYGQVGERKYDKNGRIQYLQVSNIRNTGIDVHKKYARVIKNSHNDPKRSRLKTEDVLLINGGKGSIGRSCVFLGPDQKFNISQDIDRIRLKSGLSPYYTSIFFISKYGSSQIEKFTKGVSGQTKIGFDHVRSIEIPVLPKQLQKNIDKEYLEMREYHDDAMKAKEKGNDEKHTENLKLAKNKLGNLISKTEAVIRGEREDVI